MVYVGILAQMINMVGQDPAALTFHFKGGKTHDELQRLRRRGMGEVNLEKKDPSSEPMDKTNGLIMADGNTAAALGSIFGGVQFAGWYPITPASSLAEALNDFAGSPQTRRRQTNLCNRTSGGRTCRAGHDTRRRLGGFTLDDLHFRPGCFLKD